MRREMADWSKLPEELLFMIAVRLFSVVEVLRFRSICTSWRSSFTVADSKPLPSHPLIQLNPLVVTLVITKEGKTRIYGLDNGSFLSRASFFRVSPSSSSSSSSQGWLIKCEEEELSYGKFPLLHPLSRFRFGHWGESIDLLKLKVSEIQAAYVVKDRLKKEEDFGFNKLVLGGNNRLLGLGCDGKIRYWNGQIWTRLKDQMVQFCDIIVDRGLTYALDSYGIVWWISSSLSIYRYGPSLFENITSGCCRDLRLVECCGESYIVDRLFKDNRQKSETREPHPRYSYMIHDDAGDTEWKFPQGIYYPRTVGFKVYKLDEASVKWVQVKSLGDYAFVMATDTCFSVLAHEFYGCLKNSIYFSDDDEYDIKVFKLDDGSIMEMSDNVQSCFQMFIPSFN